MITAKLNNFFLVKAEHHPAIINRDTMSYIIKNNNDYKTLNNYLLNESIVPIETTYGTNSERNNREFHEFDDFIVTFFEQNNMYYVVGLDIHTGEVGFGASVDDTLDTDLYNDSKFITSNPIGVFGKVFYILIKLVKYSNTDKIKFDSASFALGKIYDKLVKNKYFLKSLSDEGFKYMGNVDGSYTFVKMAPLGKR